MELSIATQSVVLPLTISNFTELMAELRTALDPYKNTVVTVDTIKDAKGDKARLNALRRAIDDKRKDAKRSVMAVYTPLEDQCKELIALIDESITAIDTQVKSFEDKDAEAKKVELEVFFQGVNTVEWLELDMILNPKWKNKGMPIKDLKDEIEAKICKIESEVEILEDKLKDSPFRTAVLEHYKQNLDYPDTYRYIWQLERAQAEEQRKVESEQKNAVTGTVAFRVECTAEQLKALRQYMINAGIKYELIKESEE